RPWSGPSASCRPAASWPISSSSLRLGPKGGGEVSVALIVVISLPWPPATRWPYPREAVPDRAGPMILGDSSLVLRVIPGLSTSGHVAGRRRPRTDLHCCDRRLPGS